MFRLSRISGDVRMHIRNAGDRDIEALAAMLTELFAIEKDFSPRPVLHASGLSMILRDPSYRVLVAADPEDRPVGMVSLHILLSTAEGGKVGLLEDLIVAEEYRGRGLGRALLMEVDSIVRRECLIRLQLLADRCNTRALEFYAKQGWSPTSLIVLRKR